MYKCIKETHNGDSMSALLYFRICMISTKMLSSIFNCCHCRTKYFGRTVTDQNSVYEVKSVLNSGNDYRSVQNFMSLRMLHKT